MGYSEEVAALRKGSTEKQDNIWKKVPTEMAERLMVYGTPEECVKKIDKFVSDGLSYPIIYPFMTESGFPTNVNEIIRLLAPYFETNVTLSKTRDLRTK